MIEGTEEKYAAFMYRMLEGLVKIVESKEASPADKIAAAKVIDGANDSFLKANVIGQVADAVDKHTESAHDRVNKLRRKKDWEEE